MPSNIMRKRIDQPVNAASKEQSDLGVARGVYEQLRQGVEPKLLLEQVDDAICATSGQLALAQLLTVDKSSWVRCVHQLGCSSGALSLV